MTGMIDTGIERVLQSAVAEGVFTRASVGYSVRGERCFQSIGELNGACINEFTRFDVASVTKVVPVSTLALIALDKKLVHLDTPINTICSDIQLRSDAPVTYRHLLTQTLDFRFSMSSFKDMTPKEIWDTIRLAELKAEPGTSFFYCNATSVLLGRVVEKLLGGELDVLAKRYLFDPLNMEGSTFRPGVDLRNEIVPTEVDQWRARTIQGEIHDESSWVLNQIFIPGAAGLFSTTSDLLSFVSALVQDDGKLCSKGFFSRCAHDWSDDIVHNQTGLGFEYSQPYMGTLRSDAVIGKTGFTGSVIIMDLKRKAGFTLLTDYTWPKRKEDRSGINRVRSEIADLIWKEADRS